MKSEPMICNNANVTTDAFDLISRLWLHDSLKPGADPIVSRSFRVSLKKDDGIAEDLKKEGFRILGDYSLAQYFIHDSGFICVSAAWSNHNRIAGVPGTYKKNVSIAQVYEDANRYLGRQVEAQAAE